MQFFQYICFKIYFFVKYLTHIKLLKFEAVFCLNRTQSQVN